MMNIVHLILCLLFVTAAQATDIRWTGTTSDSSDPAKTAPRSQRYWDENNIKRPDYGKTDAEIAVDRGESGESSNFWLVVVLCCGMAAFYYKNTAGGNRLGSASGTAVWSNPFTTSTAGGNRLGSTSGTTSWSSPMTTSQETAEERARRARLAHFEQRLAVPVEKKDE
jgi:hypothetical protein